MNKVIAIFLSAIGVAFAAVPARAYQEYASPLGFAVTNLVYSADGVSIDFETDQEPPYIVSVNMTNHEIGNVKLLPIAEAVTSEKHAYVQVPWTIHALNVCVGKKEWFDALDAEYRAKVGFGRRLMTRDEVRMWTARANLPPQDWTAERYQDWLDHRSGEKYSAFLVADHTWHAFIVGTNESETVMFSLKKFEQESQTIVTNSYAVSVTNDTHEGTGWRIILNDEDLEVTAQRAFSPRPEVSDDIFIPRMFRAISSNGQIKYSADYEGRLIRVPETNAVPGRVYLEGLQ